MFARPGAGDAPGLAPDDADLAAFVEEGRLFPLRWADCIAAHRAAGREVWIWGAGSRATAFAGYLPDPDMLAGAIDVNPAREGTCVLGTGCVTRLPEALAGRRDLAVIVTNPIYVEEIAARLAEIGASAELELLAAP